MFLSANAGKRSAGIVLRDPDGREALLRLAERADVFLQSLRPGLAEKLGLGPDDVRERNPRIVYCSLGAYGHTGPLAEEPGYDALMQAAGGLISVTGEPGRPGVRVGASLIDQGTGTWAALGVLAALLERDRTGTAPVVDVSLYETALGYVGYHLAGLPGRRHRAVGAGDAVPDGRAVPGAPHRRRRPDDRGRQRSAVRGDLRDARLPRARRRRALRDEPGSRPQPRRALRSARGAAPRRDERRVARAAHGGGRARRTGRGRRRHRREPADGRARHAPAGAATRRSPTCASSRSRSASIDERALHRAPRPPWARTPPTSSARPATTTTRSRRSPREE